MNVLTLKCTDKPGVVAAVATCLANNECNIEESAQFNDPLSGQFFMRVVFSPLQNGCLESFTTRFTEIADEFAMSWNIHDLAKPLKTLIMVSKSDHCLHDLLYRARAGRLNIEVSAIVSNHETCRELANAHNIPFHHLPITKDNKAEQESALAKIIEETDSELIALARYMQVLSNDFAAQYEGRIINIHHSFLPGFKGAKPYTQAYERGVKIIGATAHFASPDLDEGPIIEQEILRITHAFTPKMMQDTGKDIESRVLARAINLYTNHRIFLHDSRTVIL
ncbi:MAG: formyltetrahydrofolate deformylase [Alphaproteobacteria bacterium]